MRPLQSSSAVADGEEEVMKRLALDARRTRGLAPQAQVTLPMHRGIKLYIIDSVHVFIVRGVGNIHIW